MNKTPEWKSWNGKPTPEDIFALDDAVFRICGIIFLASLIFASPALFSLAFIMMVAGLVLF